MTIQECEIGMLVYEREIVMNSENFHKPRFYTNFVFDKNGYDVIEKKRYLLIGHIIGLDLNCTNETIAVVKWNDGRQQSIHPANLISVKDYKEPVIDGDKE